MSTAGILDGPDPVLTPYDMKRLESYADRVAELPPGAGPHARARAPLLPAAPARDALLRAGRHPPLRRPAAARHLRARGRGAPPGPWVWI